MNDNKPYNPKEIEQKIYQIWEKSGYFNPDIQAPINADKCDIQLWPSRSWRKPAAKRQSNFCIIMPPPNANEALHLGHALTITIEDLLVRFNRMRGKKTLWLPGADHAGFETQVVFEKKLEKQGKSRFDFDRKTLYKMIWDYVQSNKRLMESQIRAFGASCDWSRERLTLDPKIVEIVYATFKKLYDDGLVYRGKRVINWCPKHQTSFSELEVKYEEREDKLWYIKYPIVSSLISPENKKKSSQSSSKTKGHLFLKEEGKDFKYITVATTRPETMLGDTAVAVNPKDERYKNLIGQKVKLPLTNREIPVIADSAVEIDFGTGAVKVTPAHDQTDFEIAGRHNLEILEVINKNGRMTNLVPEAYRGLKVEEARAKVVADLAAQGLLEKEEPYKHSVGSCYKCGRTIEPMVSEQWFIRIKPLAKKALNAVKKGEVKFISKKYEKIFLHWMRNIRDWNISRQIVWGIQIPAWYCQDCKKITVTAGEAPEFCKYCKSKNIKQETDVFDTWFSSAQWPFATLMASDNSRSPDQGSKQKSDFEEFYPTTVMETGWDILFFWVARMIMLGLYRTGKVPFRYVYLHGMIQDKDKQKMSKSKGNVINPIGVLEERGADALRMSLVFGASTDSNLPFSEEKVIAQQRLANKIWNASKFVLNSLGPNYQPAKIKITNKQDKWILKELQKTIKKVTVNIEKFKFHEAAQEIYHFFWHKFCDKTIEDVKRRIKQEAADAEAGKLVLWIGLYNSLKLFHPFMPFITEAIYLKFPSRPQELLMIEKWPA